MTNANLYLTFAQQGFSHASDRRRAGQVLSARIESHRGNLQQEVVLPRVNAGESQPS